MNIHISLCLIVSSLFVSGCSSYRRNFDCPVDEGLKCASMTQVHQAMDKGVWPIPEAPIKIPKYPTSKNPCTTCQKDALYVEAVVDGDKGLESLMIPVTDY